MWPSRICRAEHSWNREYFHRNQILRGIEAIEGLAEDDLILVSDLDEIPRATTIAMIRDDPELRSQTCVLDFTFYHSPPRLPGGCLDVRDPLDALLPTQEPQTYRGAWNPASGQPVIRDAGWHFSYFIRLEEIQDKARSISHTEYDQADYLSEEHIRAAIRECRFFAKQVWFHEYEVCEPHDLPAFMLEHLDRWMI